jgi:hypothetical protein
VLNYQLRVQYVCQDIIGFRARARELHAEIEEALSTHDLGKLLIIIERAGTLAAAHIIGKTGILLDSEVPRLHNSRCASSSKPVVLSERMPTTITCLGSRGGRAAQASVRTVAAPSMPSRQSDRSRECTDVSLLFDNLRIVAALRTLVSSEKGCRSSAQYAELRH